MFALTSEDCHDSAPKGKPRLPQSQGVILNPVQLTPRSSSVSSSSSSTLGLNLKDNLVISGEPLIPNGKASALSSSASILDKSGLTDNFLRLTVTATSSTATITTTTNNSLNKRNQSVSSVKKVGKHYTTETSANIKKARSSSFPTSINPSLASLSIPNELNISIEMASLKDYRRVAKTLVISFEDDPFVNYILNTTNIKKSSTPKNIYKKKKMDLMLAFFEYSVYECLNLNGKVFVIKDKLQEATLEDMGIKTHKFPYLGVSLWNQIYGANVDTEYSSSGSDSDEEMSNDDYFANQSLRFIDNIHPSYVKYNVKTMFGGSRSKIKNKLPFLTKVRNEVLVNQLIKKEPVKYSFDIWYLSDIATLPSMRGKGLGKILINHVINEYINKVSEKAYVYLESSNPVNRKFYQKLNFQLMKTYSIKNSKYVDSEKVLSEDPNNEKINMDSMVFFPTK